MYKLIPENIIPAVKPFYKEGCRQNICIGLAALLAKHNILPNDAISLLSPLLDEDPEKDQRIKGIWHTYEAYYNGQSIQGYTLLKDIGINVEDFSAPIASQHPEPQYNKTDDYKLILDDINNNIPSISLSNYNIPSSELTNIKTILENNGYKPVYYKNDNNLETIYVKQHNQQYQNLIEDDKTITSDIITELKTLLEPLNKNISDIKKILNIILINTKDKLIDYFINMVTKCKINDFIIKDADKSKITIDDIVFLKDCESMFEFKILENIICIMLAGTKDKNIKKSLYELIDKYNSDKNNMNASDILTKTRELKISYYVSRTHSYIY